MYQCMLKAPSSHTDPDRNTIVSDHHTGSQQPTKTWPCYGYATVLQHRPVRERETHAADERYQSHRAPPRREACTSSCIQSTVQCLFMVCHLAPRSSPLPHVYEKEVVHYDSVVRASTYCNYTSVLSAQRQERGYRWPAVSRTLAIYPTRRPALLFLVALPLSCLSPVPSPSLGDTSRGTDSLSLSFFLRGTAERMALASSPIRSDYRTPDPIAPALALSTNCQGNNSKTSMRQREPLASRPVVTPWALIARR